jgi:hypothetical protein
MLMLRKSIVIGALAVGTIAATSINPVKAQIAPPPGNWMTLPDVNVQSRPGPNPGHYRVPAGYDADVALHPYTSGIGPCTEGAVPDQGCRHPAKTPIPPSHYEQPPFNQ